MILESNSDQFESQDEDDGVGLGRRLGQPQPARESEGWEVGETPEEAELVGARGRAGPDDEGGARDLQEEVETF